MPKSPISEMLNEIKGLREDLKKLLEPKQLFVAPIPTITSTETPPAPILEKPHIPVPSEYQEEKNKILNQDFGLEISYPGDGRPVFEFSVLVPEKYSNMSPVLKAERKEDRRLKVIDNALGLNGVRQYLELVYKNFNPEIQARITADRYV